MTDPHNITLIREALLEVDIACFPDFTAAVGGVCDELERFRSERSYVIGHNDGWRDALRQEVFRGTVDTDSPLEAAAREAGWALMELVDEIDFRKREEVSDIASRLAKALLDDATEAKGADFVADLILRPSTLVEGKPWALQLRYHDSVGPTDYHTITRVSDETARSIVDAGAPFFLFGDPPEELAQALPPDVVALAIAAREFWDIHNDPTEESRALDKALERFAEKVPFENEPGDTNVSSGG